MGEHVDGVFSHPHDTPISAGLRFGVELIAWVAAPVAAYSTRGGFAATVVLSLLVALPAIFSTLGDKRQVIVPTPGPVRVMIELLLYAVAAIGPWMVWPTGVSLVTSMWVLTALMCGLPRLGWLWRGAPAATET